MTTPRLLEPAEAIEMIATRQHRLANSGHTYNEDTDALLIFLVDRGYVRASILSDGQFAVTRVVDDATPEEISAEFVRWMAERIEP